MPEYCFTCVNCDKDFTKVIKIIEYDLSKVRCTHCRSKKVQRDYASENKIISYPKTLGSAMDRNKVSDDRKHIFDKNFHHENENGRHTKDDQYLNIEGEEIINEEKAVCKIVSSAGISSYYIKVNNRKIPVTKDDNLNNSNVVYKWLFVNERALNHYKNYLETSLIQYHTQAVSEIVQ
jgi:DNA-directed RNA polymerase subunit RPC12/RpoP